MASPISTSRDDPARPADVASGMPPEDFVAGLQLLRAANLQAVRLQLAMFRQQRRTAMESLDALADVDRELERFLAAFEPAAPAADDIKRLVAAQKKALAEEKIALMAEISGPRVAKARPLPNPAEEADANPIAPPDAVETEQEQPEQPPRIIVASEDGAVELAPPPPEPLPRRRGLLLAIAAMVLILAIGAGGAIWLAYAEPAMFADLSRQGAELGREISAAAANLLERLPLP